MEHIHQKVHQIVWHVKLVVMEIVINQQENVKNAKQDMDIHQIKIVLNVQKVIMVLEEQCHVPDVQSIHIHHQLVNQNVRHVHRHVEISQIQNVDMRLENVSNVKKVIKIPD